MSLTVSVLSKLREDISDVIIKMLKVSATQRDVVVGVADHGSWETFHGVPDFTSIVSDRLVAHISSNPLDYPLQPLVQESGAFSYNGLMYDSDIPDTLEVANLLEKDIREGLEKLIQEREASFSVVTLDDTAIFCARDYVGAIPLYVGENSELIAVSSNKKTLWAQHLDAQPIIPGSLVRITENGIQSKIMKKLEIPKLIKEPISLAVNKLDAIFHKVAQDIARKTQKGSVAFSGGIDSTLTAYYLKEAGIDLDLVCFGIGDRPEFGSAKKSANFLKLPLQIVSVDSSDLCLALRNVVSSIEESNPASVGIGTPLYFSALKASEMGHKTIFSGNGSDEVFGGYMKYFKQSLKGVDPSESMYLDTANSWKFNMDRDQKICRDQGLFLILPFANPKLIEYGMSLPVSYKVPSVEGEPRKIALRLLAEKLGMPRELSARPKKAAQYSTGVMKALRLIAAGHKKRLDVYINDILDDIKSELVKEI